MKTIILTVGDNVATADAINAVAAAGLEVEQRAPVAHYYSDNSTQPIYAFAEWMNGFGYPQAENLAVLAELAASGYANVFSEDSVHAEDRDALRAELAEQLSAGCEVQVAGFVGGDATKPVLLVDGLTIQGDLSRPIVQRSRRGPLEEVVIGSAIDAAAGETVEVALVDEGPPGVRRVPLQL
jgi:hypothetical protein